MRRHPENLRPQTVPGDAIRRQVHIGHGFNHDIQKLFPSFGWLQRHSFDTSFQSAAHLQQATERRVSAGADTATQGTASEYAPSYSAGSGLQPLVELQRDKKFKQVSFRPQGNYPASTGTSKTNYPCLTNGMVPCVAVMMTGATPDESRRNARLFHIASANTKAAESIVDYKKYLLADGLTNQFAVLAGGETDERKYRDLGMDHRTASAMAAQTRAELADRKEKLSSANIRVAKDDTGENRPSYMTGMANVGFELKQTDGKVKFSYLKNVKLT